MLRHSEEESEPLLVLFIVTFFSAFMKQNTFTEQILSVRHQTWASC